MEWCGDPAESLSGDWLPRDDAEGSWGIYTAWSLKASCHSEQFIFFSWLFSLCFLCSSWLPLPPVPGTVRSWGPYSTCVGAPGRGAAPSPMPRAACPPHTSPRHQAIGYLQILPRQSCFQGQKPPVFLECENSALSPWHLCILHFFPSGALPKNTDLLVATKIRRDSCSWWRGWLNSNRGIGNTMKDLTGCIWVL